MIPPEIILDRYVKENFPKGYFGKLNIERIRSSSFRTFLEGLQIETNDALRLENANASGGIVHPPFHFDYLDATVTNAHAIPLAEYWFIALTLPLVMSVVDVSKDLSRSPVVLQLLHLDSGAMQHPDILWGYIGQIQLLFLTSHEYTHLIHQHSERKEPSGIWTEFVPSDRSRKYGVPSRRTRRGRIRRISRLDLSSSKRETRARTVPIRAAKPAH